jgi:hypothetical protein
MRAPIRLNASNLDLKKALAFLLMDAIPIEILDEIISHLPVISVFSLSQINKNFHKRLRVKGRVPNEKHILEMELKHLLIPWLNSDPNGHEQLARVLSMNLSILFKDMER